MYVFFVSYSSNRKSAHLNEVNNQCFMGLLIYYLSYKQLFNKFYHFLIL